MGTTHDSDNLKSTCRLIQSCILAFSRRFSLLVGLAFLFGLPLPNFDAHSVLAT